MEYSSRESLIQYFEEEIKRMSDADIAKLKKEIDADKQKELARMELEVQHQVNLSLGVELQDVKEKYRMDVNAVLAETPPNFMSAEPRSPKRFFLPSRANSKTSSPGRIIPVISKSNSGKSKVFSPRKT